MLPRSGKSPGGGHGNPLQYSCLENPVDSGAWWVPVHEVIKNQTWLKQLSMHSQYHHRKKQRKKERKKKRKKERRKERKKERKKENEVAQTCPTLCNPVDYSLPSSSVHEILQARVLEWVAISFSRGSSLPRNWTWVSHIVGRHFTVWATREASIIITGYFSFW